MGWLIALGVLLLILLFPLGIRVIYNLQGFFADLFVGPFRFRLHPVQKSSEQKAPAKKEKTSKPHTNNADADKKQGKFLDFKPFIQIGIDLLGDLRKKLRVKILELKLVLAGDDPADLALNYGRTWGATGSLLPILERFLIIKKKKINISCDFTADETTLYLNTIVTISVGRLSFLAVRYGVRAIRQYFEIKNKSKGGAKL